MRVVIREVHIDAETAPAVPGRSNPVALRIRLERSLIRRGPRIRPLGLALHRVTAVTECPVGWRLRSSRYIIPVDTVGPDPVPSVFVSALTKAADGPALTTSGMTVKVKLCV